MKTAAIICHARFLDLATFEELLRASGYQIRYVDVGLDDLSTRLAPTSSSCSVAR